ncbi:MAG TPA: DUF3558 domain-containing protein [Pseudonocardiaceae bacterium]
MRIGLALVAVAALAALAACGSSPAPVSAPTVPTMAADPIDLSALAAKPCTMLRPDQLAQFHIVTPGSTGTGPLPTASGAPPCTWQPLQSSEPVYAAAVDLHSGGLDALYRRRAKLAEFTPFTVSGYPGVDTALAHGQCTVQIEVANGVLLDAAVTVRDTESADYPDPCSDAQSFAAAIIGNSQGQQP